MTKREVRKRDESHVRAFGRRRAFVGLGLILSLIAATAILAQRSKAKQPVSQNQNAGQQSAPSPAAKFSPSNLSPSLGSKDYVYLGGGGKVVATEEPEPSCSYSIAPTSSFYPVTGGDGIVNLTAGVGCAWTASSSNPNWLTITSATSGSGSQPIRYVVMDNDTKSARQGMLTIAGLTFGVTQDGGLDGDCTYVISPTFESFGASGGGGGVNVFSAVRCAWQAVSNASWVTVTSGCCGIGDGIVTYSVATNTTGFHRVTTITMAGSTFTVKQKP